MRKPAKRRRPLLGTPRIFVASSADFAAGRRVGKWIYATLPVGTIRDKIAAMLAKATGAQPRKWIILESRGFYNLEFSRSAGIRRIAFVARLIVKHGAIFAETLHSLGGIAFIKRLPVHQHDPCGVFASKEDFIDSLFVPHYGIASTDFPTWNRDSVDYDAIYNCLVAIKEVSTLEANGEVHYFTRKDVVRA